MNGRSGNSITPFFKKDFSRPSDIVAAEIADANCMSRKPISLDKLASDFLVANGYTQLGNERKPRK